MRLADLVPGVSACLRVAIQDGQPVACGLLHCHDGACVPFTPGDYLPPPILHPLYLRLLPMVWICPLCGAHVTTILEETVLPFRGDSENWDRVRPESQLTYSPCGCAGRILLD